MTLAMRVPRALAAVVTLTLLGAGCTPSLSDMARPEPEAAEGSVEPFDTPVCSAVRAGIDAYNAGDLPESARRFDEALPLAEDHAAQLRGGDGSAEAQDLLEAVRYYEGLSVSELGEAFPASPETRQYQVVTLSQCQPLPGGVEEEPSEQPA